MKIAMMVRGYLPVPRPADMVYAPIDLAEAMAESLSRRGHKVDFYAPTGSKIRRAKLQDFNLRPLIRNNEDFRDLINDGEKMSHYIPAMWDNYLVNKMFERARRGKYDLLHFHHPESAMPMAAANPGVPVVYTLHDPIYQYYKELFELYLTPSQHFISISNNQRRDAPDLPYVSTVYNGIDLKKFDFSSRPDDFLLYVGRIIPEKGIKEAITVARETNHRLLIIGPIPVYPGGQDYFERHIKPQLDEQILYLGFIERNELHKYYKKAKALLTPVQWEEPFGLTTIEAMACGTPVISFERGAAPEIIEHGKTGYIVENTAEMIEAVRKIKRISRAACRRHVRDKFSHSKMVDGYEKAFEEIARSSKLTSSQLALKRLLELQKTFKSAVDRRKMHKTISSTKFSNDFKTLDL